MRRADIYGGAGLLILGLVMIFVVIPLEAGGDTWSGVSPLFFPTIIASGFTLGSLALLLRALLRPAAYEGMDTPVKRQNLGFFMLSCAIVLAGVLAIHRLGIVWGGPLLVAALMLFMGERRWLRIVPISVVPIVVIYFFVTRVLNAPMP